jgi:hypothetical protein
MKEEGKRCHEEEEDGRRVADCEEEWKRRRT